MPYDPDKHQRHSIRLRGYDYRRAGAYFLTLCAQDRQRLFGEVRESEMHLNDAGRMVERWWHELNHKFPGVETDAFVVMPDHIHGIVIIGGTNDTGTDPNDPNAINANAAVGADLHIRPQRNDSDVNDTSTINANAAVGADLHIRPQRNDDDINDVNINDVNANAHAINVGRYAEPPLHVDSNVDINAINGGGYADPPLHVDSNADSDVGASLSQIVQWLKIMTTNEYIRGVKRSGWMPFRKRIWQRDYYEHIIRDEVSLDRIRRYIRDNPAHWAENRRSPQKRNTL